MRVFSLDAYRGFVMLLLVSEGFFAGFPVRLFGDVPPWSSFSDQFDHVPWAGAHLWDLIQPSFMFLVGTAIPFSYAARLLRGQSRAQIRLHALARALVLILLGFLVVSDGEPRTVFDFHNILAQIGLSYILAFWLVGRSRTLQFAVMGAVLVAYWLAFALYPAPPADFDYTSVGLPADWEPYSGLFAHWNKNVNLGTRADQVFLNLFPRDEPYLYSSNGLQTLNFVPSIATVGAGVVAGEVLRSRGHDPRLTLRLVGWGGGLVVAGLVAGTWLCPLVKLIWTPSWVLFSTGCTLLLLALFHALVDVRGYRTLVYPLIVAGANSITLYLFNQLLKPWLQRTAMTHLGDFSWTLNQTIVFLTLWGICFWMYRRRIFLKI
jgi:predicted acyltransferase